MIVSNEELWQSVDSLIKYLESQETPESVNAAAEIRSSMQISTVGTEVWMACRQTLQMLLASNIPLDNEKLNEAKQILEALTRGLS